MAWIIITKNRRYDIEDGVRVVAEVWDMPTANLIAAAPDMYDALVFVQKYMKMRADKGDPLPGQIIASVGAALAKAKP